MRNSPNPNRRRNEGKGRSKGWIGRCLRLAGYSTCDIRRCAVQCHANSPYKKNAANNSANQRRKSIFANQYINAHIDALCAANPIPYTAPTQSRTPRNRHTKTAPTQLTREPPKCRKGTPTYSSTTPTPQPTPAQPHTPTYAGATSSCVG